MTEPQAASTPKPPNPAAPRRKDIVPFSNAILYLVFCLLAGTGLAMAWKLDDSSAMLLGVAKRDWAKVHALTALSFVSLIAIHLWTNWPWLRGVLARLRWPTLVVAAVGLAVLAMFLFAPVR